MLSAINVVMIGLLGVFLVLYLLRRRTRLVTTQLNVGGRADADDASTQTTAS